MYQNKIFCALSSIALIFFCVNFRASLPAFYLVECLILFKTSIQVSFKRNDRIFNELMQHKETLSQKEKLILIDKSFRISRLYKLKVMIIVGINIIILLYLGANFYAPELLKSLLNKYKEYTNIIQERMQDLTLFQNVIYNSIFFLISFPYMSSEFTIYSKVNWSYFRFFNTISASYRYLQFLEAILLLTASFMKPTLAAYPLNLFAFMLIYEISIQEPFFFKTMKQSIKHRILCKLQIMIQYFLIIILALEYSGLPEYGLNSFQTLLSGLKTSYDGPYLLILAIAYFLNIIIDVLYNVRQLRGQVSIASDLSNDFDLDLISYLAQKERQERRQTVVALVIQTQENVIQDQKESPQNNNQIEQNGEVQRNYMEQDQEQEMIEDNQEGQEKIRKNHQFLIIRILIAIQQLYCVFIIMRFPYLGFTLSILWIFQSSITRNPEQIIQFLYLIYYPTAYYQIRECEKLDIFDQCLIWIQIIICFGTYKFYLNNKQQIQNALNSKQSLFQTYFNQEQEEEAFQIAQLIWAFILRNSYSITLVIVFWISLFTANIIHTLLLVTTILFIVRHENKNRSHQQHSFRHRNWIWMVVIINMIILLKYVYMLEMVVFGDFGYNIIELFGFQFEYNLPFNLGFNDKDFGSLSVFWMLDCFVVLQYETYKSTTYKQLQENYQKMISKIGIFSSIRQLYNVLYIKFILWICYWISLLILTFQSFNIINLFQILLLIYIIKTHISGMINKDIQYRKIQICWSIFLMQVGFATLFRYLFDFSCLQLLQSQLRKITIYEYMYTHQVFIGLSKRVPFLIFPNLVLDIAVLCLGYLGQDYLQQMISINDLTVHIQRQNKHINENNEIELEDLSKSLKENLINSNNESQMEDRQSIAANFAYDFSIQFPFLNVIYKYVSLVLPITIYIVIVITSIKYKISCSMLVYLLIMFYYIYKTRSYFIDQFQNHQITSKLNEKIIRWKYIFITKVEKEGMRVRMEDSLTSKYNTNLILTIAMITKDIKLKSFEYKKACWGGTLMFSLLFLLITYLSQSLKYFEDYIDIKTMVNIKYILFAFGTYNDYQRDDLIVKDIYPYLIALIIVIIDVKASDFLNSIDNDDQHQEQITKSLQMTEQYRVSERESLQNSTSYLIDNFYYNKYQLLKLNFQKGAIHSSERMYMIILFFLAAISEGIFSIIYILLFALVFYSSTNSKSTINKVSVLVVIFQYVSYLITLSSGSSPRILPEEFNKTEYLIFNFSNTDLLDQWGLSGKGRSKGTFIFNCIIIFAIWLFYYFQEVLSIKMILFIDQCYINMKLRKKEKHISSKFYIIIKRLYIISIVYFILLVQLSVLCYYLFIVYSTRILKTINLVMFLFTILSLYIIEIQLKIPKKQTEKRTDIYKRIIFVQEVAILIIFTILFAQKLFKDENNTQSNISIVEILIFYLLQLGKDLLESEQYEKISKDFYDNLDTRSEAVGLAMSFEANNRKLMKLIERYKDRNDLKERIDTITKMINEFNQDNRQSDCQVINIQDQYNPMAEPLKLTIYKWIESHRNRFLFEPTLQIFHFIACSNLQVLEIAEHEIQYIQNQDFEAVISYLQSFYKEATKYISPTLSKESFMQQFLQNKKSVGFSQNNEIRQIKKDWQSLKEKISEHASSNNLTREDISQYINQYDMMRFLLVIGQFIFSFWHFICFILLITYYFLNHGFFTTILPLLVFAYGAIEEQQPDKLMWIFPFIYLNFLCALEKLDDLTPFLQDNSFLVFLFGENSVVFQFITIVAIIIQVNIMKNIGLYEKFINQYETIYGSILRHLCNGTLNLEDGIKRPKQQKIVRSKSQERFQCLNTALQAQRVSIQMNQTFTVLQKLEDDLIDYLTRIKLIKPNFFFRAFSNMKPGKDVYPFMAGIQIILAIYIFLFYDQMKSMDSPSISELLKYSQFSGHMVVALLFQILCILIDRYILQYKPKSAQYSIIDVFFKSGNNLNQNQAMIQQFNQSKDQLEPEEVKQIEIQMRQTVGGGQKQDDNNPPIIRKARSLSYSEKKQIEQKQVEQVALRYKYYFQVILLISINLYLLYQIRQSTCNVAGECQYITYNIFMILFYMLICLYFFLSSIQIKYGINDQIAQNTLMKGYKFHNFVIFKIYKLMPFLFELRTICDWAFSETSLTLFQWIKLEEIHSLLYLAKCNSYFFSNKKVGAKIAFHTKFSLGFLVILVLLALLFGPIFLYSPLNPTFQNDNLIGANIEVGLKINKTNYFTLFVNSHVSDIHQISEYEWNAKNLSQYKFLNNIDKESLQIVKLTHFSDTYWDISYPSLYSLSENLKNVIDKKGASTFNLIQTYRFMRQYTDQTSQFVSDNYELNINTLKQIYESIVSCQENKQMMNPIQLQNFYHDFIRIDKNKDISILDEGLMNSVMIQLNCTANDQFWWSIYSDYKQSVGIKFYIVSDKYSSALLGYSILGFYITIVYVAGKMARGIMSGGIDLIMLQDMPYPDNLLKICEAIIMARVEKDLIQEELLYFQLIDVIRSPQLMRNISGSFVAQRLQRLEIDKQLQKKK
ncbi:unnamed protein product [Paramecium primaurelia]|uniref:Piezo non-specific cation channel R-Ras-binding domain-containing protein n=1 Tax=Paramecium primaurelia TaxID=5886 RepID=A0A8S1N0U4_PARPR|nr:unnamed protein product [Paramecium primaurelia]